MTKEEIETLKAEKQKRESEKASAKHDRMKIAAEVESKKMEQAKIDPKSMFIDSSQYSTYDENVKH